MGEVEERRGEIERLTAEVSELRSEIGKLKIEVANIFHRQSEDHFILSEQLKKILELL